ncbi:hypothetical protein [Stenotrophomonas nitritireducens]|uniref:hypothetical protein n=1 Tax=Stenotrophomonas nitritireducens TaxID=83617 RepID=UPI003D98A48E
MIASDLAPLPVGVSLNLKDGEDLFSTGYFVVSDGEFEPECDGDFLVNLKDLQRTQHHPDSARLNGCCGLDGLDGFNLLCSNGHEIGTERSDCWLPHHAVLACSKVSGPNNSFKADGFAAA